MDILIRIIYSKYFVLIGSACRNGKNQKQLSENSQNYAARKLVAFEAIFFISFDEEYFGGLEDF